MLFTTSRGILLSHVEQLKTVVTLRKGNDKENAAFFEADLYKLASRHKAIGRVRIVVFVLLYASVVSTFVSELPLLGPVTQTITVLAGVFGVGLLGLLTLFLTWHMNRLWNRMLLLYGHLVAIYEKNNNSVYTSAHLPPHTAHTDVQ